MSNETGYFVIQATRDFKDNYFHAKAGEYLDFDTGSGGYPYMSAWFKCHRNAERERITKQFPALLAEGKLVVRDVLLGEPQTR